MSAQTNDSQPKAGSKSQIVDVAIIGGGMVGATLAVAPGRVGMKVGGVDRSEERRGGKGGKSRGAPDQ